jgi:hypothetical protein
MISGGYRGCSGADLVVQLYGPFNSYSRAVYAELIPPVSGYSTPLHPKTIY